MHLKENSLKKPQLQKNLLQKLKTVEVPVTHEDISVEKRPVTDRTTEQRPVQSKTEAKVPLKQEEVQVTKRPYVKEEVSVKKKPLTETCTVREQVTSEKVKVKGTDIEEEEAQ